MSEVYDRYVDTAGNYHYTDMETGHHVIPNMAVGSFQPPHLIKTNADRIRSMTDEELSCFLANAYALGAIQEKCNSRAWLRWLKEEVKDED